MRDALLAGELGISALSPRVTTGKEQWQEWHHDFALNQQAGYMEDDLALRAAAAATSHTYEGCRSGSPRNCAPGTHCVNPKYSVQHLFPT